MDNQKEKKDNRRITQVTGPITLAIVEEECHNQKLSIKQMKESSLSFTWPENEALKFGDKQTRSASLNIAFYRIYVMVMKVGHRTTCCDKLPVISYYNYGCYAITQVINFVFKPVFDTHTNI